ILRRDLEKISSSLSFFAFEHALIFQLKENVLQELQRYLPFSRDLGNKGRLIGRFISHVHQSLESILRLFGKHSVFKFISVAPVATTQSRERPSWQISLFFSYSEILPPE